MHAKTTTKTFLPNSLPELFLTTEKSSDSASAVGQNGTKRGAEETSKHTKKVRWNDEEVEESGSEESDSSLDSEEEISQSKAKQQNRETEKSKKKDFEVVPVQDNSKRKLDKPCSRSVI